MALGSRGVQWSGSSYNPFVGCLVQDMIESGAFTEHVAFLRREYARRARILVDAVNALDISGLVKVDVPQGGYFVWVPLPRSLTESDLAAAVCMYLCMHVAV